MPKTAIESEAPEYEWWHTDGKPLLWRMGERIRIQRGGWGWISKTVVTALACLMLLPTIRFLANEFFNGQLAVGDLIRTLPSFVIVLGLLGMALWFLAKRYVTIDWKDQTIRTKRGIVSSRYPLSGLKEVVLRRGKSDLVQTVTNRIVASKQTNSVHGNAGRRRQTSTLRSTCHIGQ